MRIFIVTLVAVLSGCVTWSQTGKTELDFARDMYECKRDVIAANDAIYAAYMRDQCMKIKGWTQSW